MSFSFILPDEAATDRFGARLAAILPPGTLIALDGTLGAGKTRLVQAIGKAVGIDTASITSPTFTLVHQYPFSVTDANLHQFATPSGTIFHLDAYRVNSPEEFWELGVEEMFDSKAWTIIEWRSSRRRIVKIASDRSTVPKKQQARYR